MSTYMINYNYEILSSNTLPKGECFRQKMPYYCYQLIMGHNTPCSDCPMTELKGSGSRTWAIKKAQGEDKWIIAEYRDITTEKSQNACMVSATELSSLLGAVYNMERMLDSIQAAAYTVHTKDYRLQFLNQEIKEMLPGIHEGELCYKALWDKEMPCSFCPIQEMKESGMPSHLSVYNQKLARHLSIDTVNLTDVCGKQFAVFTAYDTSRLVDTENRLKELAYTDVLTNIKNRNAFLDNIHHLYLLKESGTICLLNIKYLKRYNLLYGKKEGDMLLQSICSLFSARYSRDHVYRVDGAKLAFLAVGESESARMRRIIGEAEDELLEQWVNPNFTLSFDTVFVPYPSCAKTPEELVFNAEYLIRKCGKMSTGGVMEFDQNEQTILIRRNIIEEILRKGSYKGVFHVYYQPIYNISSNSFSKCEALLRLFVSELGAVSPLEFIPISEESGHIGDLGKFVLDEVCQFLADRKRMNLPDIQVNVNVSSIEFARPDFLEHAIHTTELWSINPKLIQFEITESIFLNSINYVVDIMNKLIEHGFTFAIDDFGTGYSNLGYIGSMPIKCLKLDKSFMDKLLLSESYKLIITNIIELAKGLNLCVVAEGIESDDQFQLIRQLGTNFIQGYLFSKPLPREEYETFLQEHAAAFLNENG